MIISPRANTCCFSGYRPEKMDDYIPEQTTPPAYLAAALTDAIDVAYHSGFTHFITGMSRGFDLWAAQSVLALAEKLPISLICAVPFQGQDAGWSSAWRLIYDATLRNAAQVYSLSKSYSPGCFHARNRFLVDSSSRLVCYFDGKAGGTAYTVRYARHEKIDIMNLADPQLRFADL